MGTSTGRVARFHSSSPASGAPAVAVHCRIFRCGSRKRDSRHYSSEQALAAVAGKTSGCGDGAPLAGTYPRQGRAKGGGTKAKRRHPVDVQEEMAAKGPPPAAEIDRCALT